MRKIDVANAPVRAGSRYPKPYDGPCRDKLRRRLGEAAGLKTLASIVSSLSRVHGPASAIGTRWQKNSSMYLRERWGSLPAAAKRFSVPVLRRAIARGTTFKIARRSGLSFSKSARQT